MKKVEYVRVDVFADKPFGGNPLAVFPDARGLSSGQMQLLAREMNLSETTFVLPPSPGSGGDFKVRIFTADMEIPYAGHPTLGTFYVLARLGKIKLKGPMTTAMMEVKAGILPVEIYSSKGEVDKVVTVQKQPVFGEIYEDTELVAEALSLRTSDFMLDKAPIQLVSTGLPWLIATVRNRKAVEQAAPNASAFTEAVKPLPKNVVDIYVTCLEPVDRTSTTHSRAFSLVSKAIVEDPATGSASGCLGAYLVQKRLVPVKTVTSITNEQGYEIGRSSKIAIEVRSDSRSRIESVRVGGSVVHMMDGVAFL
jgi:trans-2,3-dihydro-3-hydroxyanthranilate isomerase